MYLIFNEMYLMLKNFFFNLKKKKKIWWLGGAVFCEWRHKWRTFRSPWPTSPGLGPKP